MNKYIEKVKDGKDPQVVILEMYGEMESLRKQLVDKANECQVIVFELEDKIEKLQKENKFLKSRIDKIREVEDGTDN